MIGLIAYQVRLVVRAVVYARRQRHALSRGDRVTAVRLSREAVQAKLGRLPPAFPFHLLDLARMLVASSRVDEGIKWLRLADESTGPDHRSKPAILLTLGISLASIGRYEEAESALARASELYIESAHPDFRGGAIQRWYMSTPKYRRRVANARAYVAMVSERFEDARTWYEAVRAMPGTPSRNDRLANLNNLAAASVQLGDLDRAERYVDEVHELAGEDSWSGQDYFLGTRGDLRLAQGRLKEARVDLTKVLTLRGPDPRTLLCLAETAYKEVHSRTRSDISIGWRRLQERCNGDGDWQIHCRSLPSSMTSAATLRRPRSAGPKRTSFERKSHSLLGRTTTHCLRPFGQPWPAGASGACQRLVEWCWLSTCWPVSGSEF